jgi:hypothetical protein
LLFHSAKASVFRPPPVHGSGEKTLVVTLAASPNYAVWALSNATIHVVDSPFDTWRLAYFTAAELAQPSISGTNADPDGDGAANWQEFLAGTDARNALNVLRVNIDAPSGAALIHFFAASNHGCTLQLRDSPRNGTCSDLTNIPVAPNNRTILYSDPFGATQRFYRVCSP